MSKTIKTGFLSDVTVDGIKINTSVVAHTSNYSNAASRSVSFVVMHYTGNKEDTAAANAKYFQSANRSASAHFFVDDKEIYQSVELRDRAWHCGAKTYKHKSCRNANAIGIEMCCTAGNYKISNKTQKHAEYLCAYICKLLGITAKTVDTYVLRHYDVTGKSCPAQMAGSNNAEWVAFKEAVKTILSTGILDSNDAESNDNADKNTNDETFTVKITTDGTNVRKGAGTSYAIVTTVDKGEVYTIVKTKKLGTSTWGYLKSGKGWINLSLTTRC